MSFFLLTILPYMALGSFLFIVSLRLALEPLSRTTKAPSAKIKYLFLGALAALALTHSVGLLTPPHVFETLGLSMANKQRLALGLGNVLGILGLIGAAILLQKRLLDPPQGVQASIDTIALFWASLQLTLGIATLSLTLQDPQGLTMLHAMTWAQNLLMGHTTNAYTALKTVPLLFKIHMVSGLLFVSLLGFTSLPRRLKSAFIYTAKQGST